MSRAAEPVFASEDEQWRSSAFLPAFAVRLFHLLSLVSLPADLLPLTEQEHRAVIRKVLLAFIFCFVFTEFEMRLTGNFVAR